MSWLTDQLNLNDIFRVVQHFYDKARKDTDIGHFFSRIEDFSQHEKKISAFWWLALGGASDSLPEGAPSFDMITRHINLGLKEEDLEKWLNLFNQTLDEELEKDLANAWRIKLDGIARHLKALAIEGRSGGLQIKEPSTKNKS